MDILQIKEHHLDALKEVGNIGAGHAATALSELLNKPMDMNVPSVDVVPFEEMNDRLGGEEAVVCAVFLQVQGDAPGNLFFMLPVQEATTLVQKLTGDTSHSFYSRPYSEMAVSAFNEVGNILAGSYLTSLMDFTKLQMYPSPPQTAVDMAVAIVSHGLIAHSKVSDYALVVDTEIFEIGKKENGITKGHFFLLPDPEAFDTLFQSLGVSVDE
ncbi:chemotaxis protein CheC [Alteribacter populi]|uniref:chemotaxis protein CheC n=1 Tax=Alteribacter populi TaxID=2011011 RepID=UPI000BBB64A6|nr:chemotaxis protein CheC [Alteribacter populi]